jgi:hypothetical protein
MIQFEFDMNSIKIFQKNIRTLSEIFVLRSVEYSQNLHTSIQFETPEFINVWKDTVLTVSKYTLK